MTMTPCAAHCSVHLARAAGWRCAGCGRDLCPSCVLEVEVHPTSYVKCAVCQEDAVVLTRPGTDVSFPGALRGTLRLPVGLSGLLLVYALSAAASELDGLAPPLRAVALLGWSAVA